MSNRDALRKLSKRFPAPSEVSSILDSLSKEHDRTAAIVGASILETALERLLVKSFRYSNPDLLSQLFGNRGPLSDFHSKIIIASAFGVIPPNMATEFHTIKAIRNVFAHSRVDVTFDTPEIAKEVRDFLTLNAMNSGAIDELDKLNLPNKNTYVLIVRILLIILDQHHQDRGGEPLLAQ